MIDFIACIDFKGQKEKNIHLELNYHGQKKQDFTNSYNNHFVLFKHNGCNENLNLYETKSEKFLVPGSQWSD